LLDAKCQNGVLLQSGTASIGGAMFTQTIEKTQLDSSESYQLIKDEQLASIVITSQILAGSRVLLSTYQHVVFSDCVFYACDFQGVTFENCIFDNCSFEFSHMKKCKFKNCSFVDCNWMASSSRNSVYEDCELDSTQLQTLHLGQNQVQFNRADDHTTDIYIEMAMEAA
jgi:uncharacterized protein YjbI with pentapeptide repeats